MTTSNRRDVIVDTAIELFNRETVAAVSTNRIAKQAGISPGNLYYHFDNKEEIIRAILDRMTLEWDPVWQLPPGRTLTEQDLTTAFEKSFDLQWRYRFFGRELLALLTRDPKLAAHYRSIHQSRRTGITELAHSMIDSGLLRSDATEAIPDLVEALWILIEHWMLHLELTGDATDQTQVRGGARLIMAMLTPYLSDIAAQPLNNEKHQ